MFHRLTTRLVLSHLLVIAVAMALLSFFLLSLVQGYFEQAMQQSLTAQARLTAQALMPSDDCQVLISTDGETSHFRHEARPRVGGPASRVWLAW
jgi:sensor histidine kinase regulating citrate/malate metabolism